MKHLVLSSEIGYQFRGAQQNLTVGEWGGRLSCERVGMLFRKCKVDSLS